MYGLYNEVEVYTWFYTPEAAGPDVYKPRIDRTEVYNWLIPGVHALLLVPIVKMSKGNLQLANHSFAALDTHA